MATRPGGRHDPWLACGLCLRPRRLRCRARASGLRHRCNDGLRLGGPDRLLRRAPCTAILLETGAAQYRPSLRRTEGNRGLLFAYRTMRPGLCPHAGTAAPLQLARLAALGIVVKLLVVKKQLLAGGKDKVFSAVHAFEYLVLKFHDPVVAGITCLAGTSRPPRK
jgi:hypothetical protein